MIAQSIRLTTRSVFIMFHGPPNQPSRHAHDRLSTWSMFIMFRWRPTQPSGHTRQLAPPRIHKGTNPLILDYPSLKLPILPPQIRRSTQSRRLEIDVGILVMAWFSFVDLVTDSDDVVVFKALFPPVPTVTVERCVGEFVEVGDGAPVG